jgi:hypothetical protein
MSQQPERCLGLTKSGDPCSRSGGEDGWCKTHRPETHSVDSVVSVVSVSEAAASGDRRRALEALRDRLAEEVERVSDEGFCFTCKRGSSSVAPNAKLLADVLKQLDELPEVEGSSVVDDLAARRAERKARAAGS